MDVTKVWTIVSIYSYTDRRAVYKLWSGYKIEVKTWDYWMSNLAL